MLVGPTYRLSLMGAFTAPLVVILQGFALIAPIDVRHLVKVPANPVPGVSCIGFADSLWRVRPRLHRRGNVSGAGAPAQDTSIAFDFLSSAAAD